MIVKMLDNGQIQDGWPSWRRSPRHNDRFGAAQSSASRLAIFGRELLNVCVKFQAARGRRARVA
jgi:hypothetical protein